MARSNQGGSSDVRKGAPRAAETALIERIRRRTAAGGGARGVRLGIGDDCAVLRVRRGEEMVVTTDFCLEGRHFRRDWHSAESAGHRCLARGLSDIAAMGARPVAAFLSLALPADYEMRWVDGFLHGLHTLAERFEVELAGGDTAEAPKDLVLADIVLVGAVAQGRALLRSGARAGDGVYVTGALGGSAAELRRLAAGARSPKQSKEGYPQSFPEPRVAVGRQLVRRKIASACMDLSDGLSTDLGHLCAASGLGAEIDSRALPIASGASLQDALDGGEDYELLFTSSGRVPAKLAGVPVTPVGTMVERKAVMLDGKRLKPGGWEHFSR